MTWQWEDIREWLDSAAELQRVGRFLQEKEMRDWRG